MRFSYIVNGQYLLKSIDIRILSGQVCLISGLEGTHLNLLGGVIARLFPVNEQLPWPQLQSLIEIYAGELEGIDGIPNSGVYVGSDPERHLLFSKVKEELLARNIPIETSRSVFASFGLDESFLERRICELSGGEKMRVCLALAFSKSYECYVLHGVVPWLDKTGRGMLVEHIGQAKRNNSYIVLIEHETYVLTDIPDAVYDFNGTSITSVDKAALMSSTGHQEINRKAYALSQNLSAGDRSETVLEFRDISLSSHPDHTFIRDAPLLKRISFELTQRRAYFLVGNNGAGKSTIAQLAFRTLLPDSGAIYLCGKPIAKLSRNCLMEQICYVAQNPEKQITLSNVGQYKQRAIARGNTVSLELMQDHLGLPDIFPVSQLSALQMKFLRLTTSTTQNTKLIILDEPTWGLDAGGQAKILDLLNQISKQRKLSLLIISHDISLIPALSAAVLWIDEGKLIEFETPDAFFSNSAARKQFDFESYAPKRMATT